jgi:hypothetical protein
MKPARPFKVVNCLSQGFAVAGPILCDGPPNETAVGIDLEMVQWGMSRDKAVTLADRLNKRAAAVSYRLPEHVRD